MVLLDLVQELRTLPREKEIRISYHSKLRLEEILNKHDWERSLLMPMNYYFDGGLNFVLGDNDRKILAGELLDYINKNTKYLDRGISVDVEDGFVFAFANGFYHYKNYLVIFVE